MQFTINFQIVKTGKSNVKDENLCTIQGNSLDHVIRLLLLRDIGLGYRK